MNTIKLLITTNNFLKLLITTYTHNYIINILYYNITNKIHILNNNNNSLLIHVSCFQTNDSEFFKKEKKNLKNN
jgi:hypothetical protein